jgi:hypothetical protein
MAKVKKACQHIHGRAFVVNETNDNLLFDISLKNRFLSYEVVVIFSILSRWANCDYPFLISADARYEIRI